MTWIRGTNSTDALRKALKTFIETWLADATYKPRLPRRPWKVFLPSERQSALLRVVIATTPDDQKPHVYPDGARTVSEEFHRVSLIVKGDKKGTSAQAVGQVHAALKALFSAAMQEGTSEHAARLAAGIYNLQLSVEDFEIAPGDNADEGTLYRQDLNLKCSTDTFLN